MSYEYYLVLFLTVFFSTGVGFLTAWLWRDAEVRQLKNNEQESRFEAVALTEKNHLNEVYLKRIADRMQDEFSRNTKALSQIAHFIQIQNPSLPKYDSYPIELEFLSPDQFRERA